MRKTSKLAPGTVFYIPNNPEGQKLLADIRSHLNTAHYSIRIRGRNENRKQFEDPSKGLYLGRLWQSLPVSMASYLAVYLDKKGSREREQSAYTKLWNEVNGLYRDNDKLREENTSLFNRNADLTAIREDSIEQEKNLRKTLLECDNTISGLKSEIVFLHKRIRVIRSYSDPSWRKLAEDFVSLLGRIF